MPAQPTSASLATFPVSRVYQAHIPTYPSGYWLFGFASKKYHPIDDLDADAVESAATCAPAITPPGCTSGRSICPALR